MNKKVISLSACGLLMINFVSAALDTAIGDMFDAIGWENLFLVLVFAFFAFIIKYFLGKSIQDEKTAGILAAIISLFITGAAYFGGIANNFDFQGFLFNIGIPEDVILIALPLILLIVVIYFGRKFGLDNLLMMSGVGLILISFWMYEKTFVIAAGIILLIIGYLYHRSKKRKELGANSLLKQGAGLAGRGLMGAGKGLGRAGAWGAKKGYGGAQKVNKYRDPRHRRDKMIKKESKRLEQEEARKEMEEMKKAKRKTVEKREEVQHEREEKVQEQETKKTEERQKNDEEKRLEIEDLQTVKRIAMEYDQRKNAILENIKKAKKNKFRWGVIKSDIEQLQAYFKSLQNKKIDKRLKPKTYRRISQTLDDLKHLSGKVNSLSKGNKKPFFAEGKIDPVKQERVILENFADWWVKNRSEYLQAIQKNKYGRVSDLKNKYLETYNPKNIKKEYKEARAAAERISQEIRIMWIDYKNQIKIGKQNSNNKSLNQKRIDAEKLVKQIHKIDQILLNSMKEYDKEAIKRGTMDPRTRKLFENMKNDEKKRANLVKKLNKLGYSHQE